MAACVVIADDLTGANATGVLLSKMQYRATTVMNLSGGRDTLSDCDCLLYPTDSRGVSPQEAYRRVKEAAQKLISDKVQLYSKRIDSTLRGNLGSETDAILDSLGDDYIAIVAPCFPSSGRVVIGGYMLVDGIPLHKTNIALDPKCPVKISEVETIIREQSKYPVATVQMKDLMNGKDALARLINRCHRDGARIITFDCVTQEDLDLIADACITSREKIVAVDPGVFTATMARKIIKPRMEKRKNRILVVVGSVNASTTAQLEEFWLSQEAGNVFVRTRELLEGDVQRLNEIDRVTNKTLAAADKYPVSTVVGDGIYPENRIDFEYYAQKTGLNLEQLTGIINDSLAEITYRILREEPSFRGLYASGGDVTQAVCRRFGADGLELRDEVLPLAAYGQFSGGAFDGLDFITKGGSQGNKDAINQCITYLKEQLFI